MIVMGEVRRMVPPPATYGPARELYELAGPADPTFDELSPRLQRAYASAARYLRWEGEQDGLPGVLQTPQSPESGVQAWERQVAAVLSALKRSEVVMAADGPGGAPSEDELRSLAEECVAAADTGI